MNVRVVFVAACGLVPLLCGAQTEFYSNDFADGVANKVSSTGSGTGRWADPKTQKMPDGKTWLLGTFGGKAGKQEVLILDKLPSHKAVVVIVDLVFINSWSNSNANFSLGIRSTGAKDEKGIPLWAGNPAGSLTSSSSGDYGLPGNPDQTYHLMFAREHSGQQLLVDFIKGLTEREDMAFGLRRIRVLGYADIDSAERSIPPEQEILQLHHFPIKARADKSFEDGGGADWVIDTIVSKDGRLDFQSNIKAHRSLNGWCGRFGMFLFDQDGNVLAQFGMPDDHCWCVNGRLNPAGLHERNDHLVQHISVELLRQMRSIGFQQVTTPGCHSILSLEEAKKELKKLKE